MARPMMIGGICWRETNHRLAGDCIDGSADARDEDVDSQRVDGRHGPLRQRRFVDNVSPGHSDLCDPAASPHGDDHRHETAEHSDFLTKCASCSCRTVSSAIQNA